MMGQYSPGRLQFEGHSHVAYNPQTAGGEEFHQWDVEKVEGSLFCIGQLVEDFKSGLAKLIPQTRT